MNETMHEPFDAQLDYQYFIETLSNKYSLQLDNIDLKDTHIVNVQAGIELAWKLCTDFNFYHKEIYKVTFSIKAMAKEIDILFSEVDIIRTEAHDLYEILLKHEYGNKVILKIVQELSTYLLTLREKYYTVGHEKKSRILEIIQANEKDMDAIQQRTYQGDQFDKALVNSDAFDDATISLQRFEYLQQIYAAINEIHCQFSFLLIYMHFNNQNKQSRGIFGCAGGQGNNNTRRSNILKPDVLLPQLNRMIINIGTPLNSEVANIRNLYTRNLFRQEELIQEIRKLKRILFDTLMQMHTILHNITDLEEKNDALVGKMIKSRPLFKRLNDLLLSGSQHEDGGIKQKQKKKSFLMFNKRSTHLDNNDSITE